MPLFLASLPGQSGRQRKRRGKQHAQLEKRGQSVRSRYAAILRSLVGCVATMVDYLVLTAHASISVCQVLQWGPCI